MTSPIYAQISADESPNCGRRLQDNAAVDGVLEEGVNDDNDEEVVVVYDGSNVDEDEDNAGQRRRKEFLGYPRKKGENQVSLAVNHNTVIQLNPSVKDPRVTEIHL